MRNITTGQRFGRLVTIAKVGRDKQGYVIWRCQCDCGNEKDVSTKYLGKGTSSCGCLAKEQSVKRLTTHGKRYTRLYTVHHSMMQRCYNPNAHEYCNYGARGIEVCAEWHDFLCFEEWATSNGYDETAPQGKCTLDRINTDGNYEPNNCRFVPMEVQQRNRRNNRMLSYNGETRCMKEWADLFGVPYGTFQKRIKAGWPMGKALISNR